MALRRRCLLALATLCTADIAGAIEWSSSTSSSSTPDLLHTAAVGDIITIVIEPDARASIDFTSEDTSDHFAVSYRQCSSATPQPLQIQYADKLNYVPYVGGCIYAENELAEIGAAGCTFWQYNPAETYQVSGLTSEDSVPLEPGRVRFENQGDGNATVEVVMFSVEVPVPVGLVDDKIWIEDSFVKKDRVVNTSVNVYFNNDDNFCDEYGCTVSGYVNDYIEGQSSLSLCQVQETGEVYFDKESFKSWIALSFELPEDGDYFVTLIVSAKENNRVDNSVMESYGLDQIMVFQTDTTQDDSSARLLAGLSVVTLTWLILFNTLFSALSSANANHHGNGAIPALGW